VLGMNSSFCYKYFIKKIPHYYRVNVNIRKAPTDDSYVLCHMMVADYLQVIEGFKPKLYLITRREYLENANQTNSITVGFNKWE